MTDFNNSGAQGSLQACLDLLESVSDLDLIPAYDVNWFGLPKAQFLGLTPMQRQHYFRECRRFGWRPSNGQVNAAHTAATAI